MPLHLRGERKREEEGTEQEGKNQTERNDIGKDPNPQSQRPQVTQGPAPCVSLAGPLLVLSSGLPVPLSAAVRTFSKIKIEDSIHSSYQTLSHLFSIKLSFSKGSKDTLIQTTLIEEKKTQDTWPGTTPPPEGWPSTGVGKLPL